MPGLLRLIAWVVWAGRLPILRAAANSRESGACSWSGQRKKFAAEKRNRIVGKIRKTGERGDPAGVSWQLLVKKVKYGLTQRREQGRQYFPQALSKRLDFHPAGASKFLVECLQVSFARRVRFLALLG
jgi:hypothetical protein